MRNMRRFGLVIGVLAILWLPGCSLPSGAGHDTINVTGVVHHSDLEGDFWFVKSDDGTIYDPVGGLPVEYQKEDLHVRMEAKIKRDAVTTHMIGTVVEIVKITPL